MRDSLTLDRFDITILHELQLDGRQSWVELSNKVNLSPSACQRRTQALTEQGIIDRFAVSVNVQRIGFDVEAFVAVTIERQNQKLAEQFRRAMLDLPEIQSCHMLSGSIDFILRVIARNLRAYGQFIQTEILSLPGVKDATSSIVLERIKEFSAIPE
ncbi:MAG: Lrp/AsnC family transcriptional regulator [Pseudomonadota bacterium]